MSKKPAATKTKPTAAVAVVAEAPAAPILTPAERLRSRALDLLRTTVLETILESDEPLRTVDAAKYVADRLDLTLTEDELGGLATLVRMVLDSDPLFSQSNRQWDLALRMGRADGDRRKPVERAIEDFIDLLGHPTDPEPVAAFIGAVYGRLPDYYEKMLERMVVNYPQFFKLDDGRIGIQRWLLEISSEDAEEVEWDNFEDPAALNAIRALKPKGGDAVAIAKAAIKASEIPADSKAVQFVGWSAHPETDPQTIFTGLYEDDELSLERGPAWVTLASHQAVIAEIRSLALDPQSVTELIALAVPEEVEEVTPGIVLAQTTARVSDDDLDQVYSYMLSEDGTQRLSELLQQVLEAFPGSRTYSGIRDSLLNRMRDDHRFQWLGFERFRIAGNVPAEVEVLPEGLAFDDSEYLGEEGEEIDKTVDPREWKFNLDEQIKHYLVQDVGDDSSPVGPGPQTLVSSPPLHHFVAGTRYLRNIDRGFFPVHPEIIHATLAPADGEKFDVWINNRLGMVYGLKEWYDAHLPWVGGEFTIERTAQQDEFNLIYDSGTNELMDIPLPRLQQLLVMRGEAAAERLPLTEIVTRLLKAHDDGINFVTLFAELNVVRRTRRAVLASILSSQRFFAQNPQAPGQWSFDEKRASKAKKKGGPKRPMREMYDEDDEDLE